MSKKRHWFFDSSRYKVRVGTGGEFPNGRVLRTHSHPWHQLTFAPRGVMTVRTPDGAWIVPPHRAVWVPARTRHSVEMSGAVLMQALYFAPRFGSSLPSRCRVLEVSPLLRELMLRVGELKWLDVRIAAQARMAAMLLDEIHVMEAESDAVHVPLPRDARARRIAALLRDTPSDRRPLAQLAKIAGASKRTAERLFRRETGIGFGRWRQQVRLGHALRLLAAGDAVTSVALEVGYQSPSAFIAAFRMTFGHTPGQYFRAA
jgi:AraC-like DNA-binding protein